jgi:hypothetical protein
MISAHDGKVHPKERKRILLGSYIVLPCVGRLFNIGVLYLCVVHQKSKMEILKDEDEHRSTWDGWYSHISLDLDEYVNYCTSIFCG